MVASAPYSLVNFFLALFDYLTAFVMAGFVIVPILYLLFKFIGFLLDTLNLKP